MADSNFKVRYGLTVDGDAILSGDLQVSGNDIKSSSGSTAITLSGTDVAVAGDLTVTGNDIKASGGTTAITFTGADVAVAGDLTVTGNDIKSSTATAITLSGSDATIAGDLAVNGGDITTNQTTFNLLNTTATTLNIGGGATTAVVIGNTAGEVDTPSDIQQTGTKSIRQGDGPYSGSTDIYRDVFGNTWEGLLVSNNNMTNAVPVVINRLYGASSPSDSSIVNVPTLALQYSRGTQASGLPVNSGNVLGSINAWGNIGDTTGSGSGLQWENDLYTTAASPGSMAWTASGNHRQTLQATITASVAGTTLTVTAVASGTITPGQELRIAGVTNAAKGWIITRQLTSTAAGNALGSTGTYELSNSPGTVASTTMTTLTVAASSVAAIRLMPSVAGGNVQGNAMTRTVIPNSDNTQMLNINTGTNGGNISSGFTTFTVSQGWTGFPTAQRVINAITGGNTLDIGTHGMTTTGASFRVTTAGNPNGLTTGTTYFVDTIPTGSTITLRTNSVSGGAVTGLTNGTNLFIAADVMAQHFTGNNTNLNNSTIQLFGARRGYNYYNSIAANDNTRQNDILGAIRFVGQGLLTGTTYLPVATTQITASATQDWTSNTATGSRINFDTLQNGTTNVFTSWIGVNGSQLRTASLDVVNIGGTTNLSLDSSGNLTVTGNLRLNGNTIQNSTGNNAITMATGATPLVTTTGNLQVSGNNIVNSTGNTAITMATGATPLVTTQGSLQINGNAIQNSTGNNIINMGTGANALTTLQGSLRLNGNNILAGDGNTNITLSSNTLTTFAGDIKVSGNEIQNGGGTNAISFSNNTNGLVNIYATLDANWLQVNKTNAAAATDAAVLNFYTSRASGGAQNGDTLGIYKFNSSDGTNTFVFGGGFNFNATENWSPTATGTKASLILNKQGTTTALSVLEASPESFYIRSNNLYFQNNNSVALTSANINYTRTYGEFAYTNATGFAIAAQNTIYTMPLDTTLNNSGVTISGTGNININVSGWYKIIMSLQATLTVTNQPAQFDFWLRKNGADVANSKTQVDLLKDQKSVISMDWLVNSNGSDYWEIVYVGTTANYADIDFPTIAATTTPYVSPVAPALLVNVIPAGM